MTNPSGAPSIRVSDVAVAGAMVAMVTLLIVPLPEFLVDLLLTFNIAAAVVIVLVSIFTGEVAAVLVAARPCC